MKFEELDSFVLVNLHAMSVSQQERDLDFSHVKSTLIEYRNADNMIRRILDIEMALQDLLSGISGKQRISTTPANMVDTAYG